MAEFQVNKALGTTVPRKKIKASSSLSAVVLSELMVKVADLVPPMEVDAAEMLLTERVPIYALFQYLEVEPRSLMMF